MKLGGVGRFGVRLIAGASLAIATGCASYGGWGAAPPMTATAASSGHGAPRFAETSGLGAFTWRETAVPPWVRVQDCAIVAISSPDRWACPDGKVYTSFDLSRARTREYELPPLPPPPPIVLTAYPEQPSAPVEKLVLRGVHFDFNKADIRSQDAAVLDEASETLKSHPQLAVNVNGYCDSIGGVQYNLRLSQRRADSVVHYLADHGVAESRMSAHGFGKTDFIASNSTAEGRAQNRRVEMVPSQSGKVFIMGVPQ
jgi:OmpA-OmpF porin, OOP family